MDFAASWCGPCKFMEPAVHAMAAKFTDVEFAKIDVDELPVTLIDLCILFGKALVFVYFNLKIPT